MSYIVLKVAGEISFFWMRMH